MLISCNSSGDVTQPTINKHENNDDVEVVVSVGIQKNNLFYCRNLVSLRDGCSCRCADAFSVQNTDVAANLLRQ